MIVIVHIDMHSAFLNESPFYMLIGY